MRFLLAATVFLVLSGGVCAPARADYFVWEDPGSGLTLSFPDTWKRVSSSDPDDVLTIMAPSGRAHAACRVRVDADRRFVIYPQQYRPAIQKTGFGKAYWEHYLAQFDDPQIYETADGAGLGRSVAGWALAGFKSAVQGPYMDRTALMIASIYNDRVYVLECSSHRDAFEEWKEAFESIAGSIDFRKTYHENVTGDYRDFLKDAEPLRLKGDMKALHAVEY